jgi:hypothetical protein
MNKYRVWIHLAGWGVLYLLWVTVLRYHALSVSRTLTVEFCYLVFIAAGYYFHSLVTIPRLLYKGKYLAFGLLLPLAAMVAAGLRVPLVLYLNAHYFLPGAAQPAARVIWVNSLLNILVWTVCLVAARLVADKIRLRQHMEALEKEQSKNELALLKAQLNPHFLFNSINSIYGHIDKRNSAARRMLVTFSDMLRYQLYECNTERVAIGKEIQYIHNYVVLQQARKEESLVVCLDISEVVKGCFIAPLLFISFIENAFKYVSNSDIRENRVEVLLDKKGDCLFFRTYNTKDQVWRPEGHAGIGLANTRRRLELLYPGRHRLLVEDGDDYFEVNLTISL